MNGFSDEMDLLVSPFLLPIKTVILNVKEYNVM